MLETPAQQCGFPPASEQRKQTRVGLHPPRLQEASTLHPCGDCARSSAYLNHSARSLTRGEYRLPVRLVPEEGLRSRVKDYSRPPEVVPRLLDSPLALLTRRVSRQEWYRVFPVHRCQH